MSRVVFVTGGTRGIGRGIARMFEERGDTVVVGGRREPEDKSLRFIQGDIRDPDQVQSMIDGIVAVYGGLEVVVNNAGGSPPADTATVSPRFTEAILRLNLTAPLLVAQAANIRGAVVKAILASIL